MTSQPPEGQEGRVAGTWQNRAAGRMVRDARRSLGPEERNQAAFVAMLSKKLGVAFTTTALSGWENGKRSVPGAVLVTVALATGQSLDVLLSNVDEPTTKEWAEHLGFGQRMADLERALQDLRAGTGYEAQLTQVAEVVARLQATVETQGELLDRIAKEVLPAGPQSRSTETETSEPSGRA